MIILYVSPKLYLLPYYDPSPPSRRWWPIVCPPSGASRNGQKGCRCINNLNIDSSVITINITLRWLLAVMKGHFWRSAKIKILTLANLFFENLKHMQNSGTLPLTAPCISSYWVGLQFFNLAKSLSHCKLI